MNNCCVAFVNAECLLFAKWFNTRTVTTALMCWCFDAINLGRVKRIWYLSPMRAAKVQASLRIRAVSPEPPLLAHTSSESRGTFRQKARSLAPLNGWACAVKICHDGMLEDTNSLDGAQSVVNKQRQRQKAKRRVALWFILRGASCFKVLPCSLSSSFFVPFSMIMITSFGEWGAGLCVSRASVCLFCTC